MHTVRTAILAALGVISLVFIVEAQVSNRPLTSRGTEDSYRPPRTAWGDPDLRGMYPLDQVGRTPMQRRPQYGNRLLMTDEEYAEALAAAAEVEAGADREDANNQLGAATGSSTAPRSGRPR